MIGKNKKDIKKSIIIMTIGFVIVVTSIILLVSFVNDYNVKKNNSESAYNQAMIEYQKQKDAIDANYDAAYDDWYDAWWNNGSASLNDRPDLSTYPDRPVKEIVELSPVVVFSFFGMLLFFTFLIKSFSPSVDVSIGDYKPEPEMENIEEVKKNVDNRLAMIQDEDQGRNFTDLMKKAEDAETEAQAQEEKKKDLKPLTKEPVENVTLNVEEAIKTQSLEPVYKVYIGSYTSSEQAKVAKDIITEAGSSLTPIVKCIGTNSYTLQVGIFKNKESADALLNTIQQSHLPGRIVQDY